MSILYYGPDICKPSHLWMRRNMELIIKHITVVVEEKNPNLAVLDGKRIVILPQKRSTSNKLLSFVFDYINYLKRKRILYRECSAPDVKMIIVHFLTNAVPYIDIWKKLNTPVFVHCHGIDITWEKTGVTRKWRKLWLGDYIESVLALPSHVKFVANSAYTKKKLQQIGIAENRIFINHQGVPVPETLPARNNRRVKILFLGRLVDVKGPDFTIKAFDLASRMGMDAELIIAGDGPLKDLCVKLASESAYSSRIAFKGAVDGITGDKLRAEADIFTAHSIKGSMSKQEEAYGLAFLEAMAMGLPVVTGASGFLPYLVRDNIDGILFQPGDIEAHAKALLFLSKNKKTIVKMGANAAQRVKDAFTLEGERKNLFAIYGIQCD